MAKLVRGTKELNKDRVIAIEAYDYSLFNLCNPNTKSATRNNPIAVESALGTLKGLAEELDAVVIDMAQIDCDRVYGTGELTETELFIKSVNNGHYAYYSNDYRNMAQNKELDSVWSRAEREALVDSLENEIKREYRKIETVGKLNKGLRKASEEKINELSAELRQVLSTLEAPEKGYIDSMLYMLASGKVVELKDRVATKIKYLEGVLG